MRELAPGRRTWWPPREANEKIGGIREPLGAAIGFTTLLWISAIVILLGAEFNAEIEH